MNQKLLLASVVAALTLTACSKPADESSQANQTVHIVVHNHEGEIEAHLNHDGIEYDFNQDPSNKNQYTSNHGFADNQKTILTIDGNKAVVTGDTNQVLLDCVKAS